MQARGVGAELGEFWRETVGTLWVAPHLKKTAAHLPVYMYILGEIMYVIIACMYVYLCMYKHRSSSLHLERSAAALPRARAQAQPARLPVQSEHQVGRWLL